MHHARLLRLALAAATLLPAAASGAPPVSALSPGRVTGIGGVFVKSKDPKALATWYRDVLGLDVKPWGGATLPASDPARPPVAVWTAFPEGADEFGPSKRDVVINLGVDDLDAIAAKLAAKGVEVHRQPPDDNGRFAWILDPDGTKIELWEPMRP